MTGPSLRVAVATDWAMLRWQALCVEALAAVPGVTIERWVRDPGASAAPGGTSGARGTVDVPEALWRLVSDDGPSPEAAVAVSPAAPVADTTVDVLLDLTSAGLPAPLEQAPEVWHYGYGDTLARDPGSAARIDFIRHPGRSRVALIAEPGGRIVRDGVLSWWRGEELERILIDPSGWPATAALDRTDPVTQPPPAGGPVASTRRGPARAARRGVLEAAPLPIVRMATFGRRVQRAVASVVRHDGWNVGIANAPIDRMLGPAADDAITWLPARPGLFAADPFGIERDGVLHVFFEEYDQAAARGTISHIPVAADGTVGDPEPVLDPGVHTSYPFLVEDQGATFMLPETSAAGELVLYAAADFPLRWRREVALLSGVPAVDASVVRFEGRWWMFATRIDRGANHNLFIWHAPELTGPWTAHAANPVKMDSGSARPGGTPYIVDGKLFRPSQDDASLYGGAVVVNEVDVLTPRSFAEHPVGAVRPRRGSAYPDGLHTLSAVGRRTLVDGNHLGFVKERFAIDVTRKLQAIRGRRPA